jgi:N-acetyl-anhydromuramyl-L-alanine amidase AmpD
MRSITMIVIHCSDVPPGVRSSAKDIDGWHKDKGWKGIGYHFVVRRDGTVETGRRLEEIGAHCVGHNKYSIGICYEGGRDAAGRHVDTRTPAQVAALRELVERMHAYFPKAVILGHRDLNPTKDCPCFDAVKEYQDLQAK